MFCVPLFLCALLLLSPLARVYANDGYVGSVGQTAFPLKNSDIVMEREKVVIEDLGADAEEALVECTFWFKNTKDSAVEVEIGFPEERVGDQDNPYYEIRDFKTWIDGIAVNVETKQAVESPEIEHFGDYTRWFTWKVAFKPGELHVIKNTYRIHQGANNYGGWDYRYVLKTGALWAGKVGKAEVYFKSPRFPFSTKDLSDGAYVKFLKKHLADESKKDDPWFLVHLTPPIWVIEDGAVKWTFENFEPEQNIVISHTGAPEFYEKILKTFPKTQIAKDALLSRITGSPVAAYGQERLDAVNTFIKWFPKEKDAPEILLGYAMTYQQLGDDADEGDEKYYKKASAFFEKLFKHHLKWDKIAKAYLYAAYFYKNSVKDEKKALESFQSAVAYCTTREQCHGAWSGLLHAYSEFKKWKELKSACEKFTAWAKQNDYDVKWVKNYLDEAESNLSSK